MALGTQIQQHAIILSIGIIIKTKLTFDDYHSTALSLSVYHTAIIARRILINAALTAIQFSLSSLFFVVVVVRTFANSLLIRAWCWWVSTNYTLKKKSSLQNQFIFLQSTMHPIVYVDKCSVARASFPVPAMLLASSAWYIFNLSLHNCTLQVTTALIRRVKNGIKKVLFQQVDLLLLLLHPSDLSVSHSIFWVIFLFVSKSNFPMLNSILKWNIAMW